MATHFQHRSGLNACGSKWSATGWTTSPMRVTCPPCLDFIDSGESHDSDGLPALPLTPER